MDETSSISCPRAADLDVWANHAWTDGLQIDTLPDLDHLLVRTRNSLYEITVVSSRTGEVLVRGGAFFPTFVPARLAGSSLGGSFLKTRGIYVGFQMELQHGALTVLTTRVRSIARAGRSHGAVH
jgi:hypothetical protein